MKLAIGSLTRNNLMHKKALKLKVPKKTVGAGAPPDRGQPCRSKIGLEGK